MILCSGFPTQLVILAAMSAFGMRLQPSGGSWSPVFVATLSLVDTALVIGLIFLFLRAHRERARDVFVGRRPVWREAIAGVALVPVVFLLASVLLKGIITFAPELHNVPRNPMLDLMQNPWEAAMFGIVVMIAGASAKRFSAASSCTGSASTWAVESWASSCTARSSSDWTRRSGAGRRVGDRNARRHLGMIYLMRRSIIAPMVSHAGFNLAQLVIFMALQ